MPLPRICLILYITAWLSGKARTKWVEGRVNTKDNWAFLSRFCFLSIEGQFEYLIEFDRDMGTPNLLLYYDDESQWPAIYHSTKTCKEREMVLNKVGQNQIVKLSHWYPDTEYSGCILTKENKELPSAKSTTQKPTTTKGPKKNHTSKNEQPLDPSYYDQFLKTTTPIPKTTTDSNSTTWFEVLPTDENFTTTSVPEDELWENIGPEKNGSHFENINDVEILFDRNTTGRKIKRSTFELYERYRRRRLNSESYENGQGGSHTTEKLVIRCHNSRRFRSARERWWFISISNCDSNKGLDVRYKFLMTNGPDGDFWHEHFSADEFYVLPVLLAYSFAYVIVMVAVVMCSVELKSRHLLHATYKLFLVSVAAQHVGVVVQSLAYIRYATHGFGGENARIVGQFLTGVSETSFLLLLLLMAKGYTITRGRLKVGFTVKLTVFMCCYIVTYIVLFVYQAKCFDPGEVLYLYESPAGYGLIVLRAVAWCAYAYATFFTVKKYPEKNMFYCPFFISGTLWFHAGPVFILAANTYIDKWVRESVVTAVLLFITFNGHIMFLLLTLPVFANKNFPYHVRTTQIGVMEMTGNNAIDGFGHNAYHPGNGAPQTVIIPLTRRTEELIGNIYSQYMASAPPLSLENGSPKLNSLPHSTKNLIKQGSTDTNASDDIKPYVKDEIFTIERQMSKIDNPMTKIDSFGSSDGQKSSENHVQKSDSLKSKNDSTKIVLPIQRSVLPHEKFGESSDSLSLPTESLPTEAESRCELPSIFRSKRNILEPIKREDVPSWSLAKGPSVVAMQKKKSVDDPLLTPETNGVPPIIQNGNAKKVPAVRNGLQPSSGEISTILEGRIQSYQNTVSKATVDLFSAGNKG